MEPYVELFTKNFKNFKLELTSLIKLYGFDFSSLTSIDVYYLEEATGKYFFFRITYCNVSDDECDERVSQMYPVDFKFQNYSMCKDLEDIENGLEPTFVIDIEAYSIEHRISEENQSILNQLKTDRGKLYLEKFKIERGLIGHGITNVEKRENYIRSKQENELPSLIQKIIVIDSFIDDINDGTF